MAQGRVFVGTSGWSYPHWVGSFYPEGTDSSEFLHYYAEHFGASEVNYTFYQLPASETLDTWLEQTPAHFVFACKASRYITHIKKLKDPEETTPKFFDAISHLGSRCGPVLFQLPPNWRPNPQRLEEFLAALPKDYRYVFEFRDADWHTEAVYETLRDANVGLVIADIGGETSPLMTTSDTVYIRLHGPEAEAYRGSYSDRAIDAWADRIREWRQRGDTVYCFFDNDEAGYAPSDALRLMHRLSG